MRKINVPPLSALNCVFTDQFLGLSPSRVAISPKIIRFQDSTFNILFNVPLVLLGIMPIWRNQTNSSWETSMRPHHLRCQCMDHSSLSMVAKCRTTLSRFKIQLYSWLYLTFLYSLLGIWRNHTNSSSWKICAPISHAV